MQLPRCLDVPTEGVLEPPEMSMIVNMRDGLAKCPSAANFTRSLEQRIAARLSQSAALIATLPVRVDNETGRSIR